MKLFFCPYCTDIVKLFSVTRKCNCGKSFGKYVDDIKIILGGEAVPIGINNTSFFRQFVNRNDQEIKNRTFEAFFIDKYNDEVIIKK